MVEASNAEDDYQEGGEDTQEEGEVDASHGGLSSQR